MLEENQIPFVIAKLERGEDLNVIEKMFAEVADNDLFSKSELSEIDDSLHVIGDLDDATLNAIGTLLTIAGTNPQAIEKQKLLWPSFSSMQKADDDPEPEDDDDDVTKSEGLWPTVTGQCPRPSRSE